MILHFTRLKIQSCKLFSKEHCNFLGEMDVSEIITGLFIWWNVAFWIKSALKAVACMYRSFIIHFIQKIQEIIYPFWRVRTHTSRPNYNYKRESFCLFFNFMLAPVSWLIAFFPLFADVMWRIKHAQRTRAGAMAYADVCLFTTHSFPSSTRVRAATHVYDLCVLKACVKFNILPTLKLKLKLTSHNRL